MTEVDFHSGYNAMIERCFDLPKPASLYFEDLGATASLIEFEAFSPTFSTPLPYDDAFILIVRLKAGAPFQLWIDGKFLASGALPAGSHSVLDQRTSPYCLGHGSCRHVQFHLPRPQLNALALQEGYAPIDKIDQTAGFAIIDSALANLGVLFEPMLRSPHKPADLLVSSYLTVAVASRLISMRGRRRRAPARARPALTTVQVRLATERLHADFEKGVSIFELASLCEMPVRDFVRAFCTSTGTSLHMWIQRRRIDRAIDLINKRTLDLTKIAAASGFGDVAKMELGFMSVLGHPPSAFLDASAGSRYLRH